MSAASSVPVRAPAESGLLGARARHPAARAGRPDPFGLAARVASALAAGGASAPEVAAAAIATRGLWGMDPSRFAAALDLPAGLLAAVEAGTVEAGHLPPALRRAAPFPDLLSRLQGARPVGSVSSPAPGSATEARWHTRYEGWWPRPRAGP